jgi:uncharacterized protein (DUF924 family)
MTDEARAIREFWFGELPLTPQALSERMQFWFGEAGAPQDGEIRTRFGTLIERAAGGELASWAGGPRRRLSLILLLDQFPLDPVERLFFYMPLQHAERLEAQDEALAAYRRLLAEVPEPFHATFAGALHAAEQHRAIIERFGRFPHRNLVLERVSTAAEEQWLRENPNHFGQ